MSVILLSLILLTQFRTGRDTALVLFTTILGILGTYGISGILKLTFNAAMNSIPILPDCHWRRLWNSRSCPLS